MGIMPQLAGGLASASVAPMCMPPVPTSNLLPGVAGRAAARKSVCMAAGKGLSYKDAGVDINAGNELVRRIQKLNPSIGGFSGMVPFGEPYCLRTAA